MSRCSSCGAEIDWIRTVAGKATPVEGARFSIQPDLPGAEKRGETVIVTDGGEVLRGRFLSEAEAARSPTARTGRLSHFARCPSAVYHRTPARRAKPAKSDVVKEPKQKGLFE